MPDFQKGNTRMSVRLAQILAFLSLAMSPIVQCAALAQAVVFNPYVQVTGSLHDGRYSHTATLLPNGQVLVAGGSTQCVPHNTAELYDPVTGLWRPTGNLNRRIYHSATLLRTGQVLVVGGSDFSGTNCRQSDLNTAELYDPATEVWRPTQSAILIRGGNRALLLPDGRVLAVGFDGSRQVAELFDPSTESWSLTNPPSEGGWGPLALLPSGLVLGAFGNSPQLYDPAAGTWSRTSNLKAIEAVGTLTVLRSGLVLATGSRPDWRETLAELYDPATGAWQLTGKLAQKPSWGQNTATLMPNGHVLVAGGADGNGAARSIELYDPAAGVWSSMPDLVHPRDDHTATLLANDKVLFAGGWEGDPYWIYTIHSSTELFDLNLPPDSSLVGDFNADGKSDILWRSGKRDLVAWQMNGLVISSNSLLPTPPWWWWSPAAVGDFDGDSKGDILWRSVSGDVAVWLMDGARIASFHTVGRVWTGWTISGVGDFDGDRRADILWRSVSGDVAVWLMDGARIDSSHAVGNVWTGWTISGVEDFDGDRRADILWRDTAGDVAIWLMDGPKIASAHGIGNVSTGWSISGLGDFDGNHRADILWRHTAGDVAIWLMDGPKIASAHGIGNVWTGWRISGVGDFDGDRRADILWQETGLVGIWRMDGNNVIGYGLVNK